MNTTQVLYIVWLVAAGFAQFPASGAEPAAPILSPPQDRSLLPAPRDGVVMVQTITYPLITGKTR